MKNSLLLLLILLFSCKNDFYVNTIIEEAEAVVSSDPDSALYILSRIPDPDQLTDSIRAKYWLAVGQAHYNSGKSMAEDSELISVMDFYRQPSGADVRRLLQAYKLSAQYLWWNDKKEDAFDLLNEGLGISQEYKDSVSYIHLLKSLANLSEKNKDIESNIQYTKQLLEVDDKAPDVYNYYGDLGIMYYYLGKKDSSVYYLNKALLSAGNVDSLFVWSYLSRSYADILSDFGDNREAVNVQRKVLDYYVRNDDRYLSLSYISLSRYYLNLGQKDSAFYYMQLAENTRHPFMDEDLSLSNYYTIQKTLLEYAESKTFSIREIVYFSNRMFEDFIDREKMISAKNESQQMLEMRNLSLLMDKQRSQLLIMVIVFALIILFLLTLFYIQKRKKVLEEKEEELETFKNLLSEAQKTNNKDDKFFKKMLLQQLGIIKMMATNPTTHNQELLVQMGRIMNKDIPVDDLLIWDDLYGVIDSVFDGFYSKIKRLYADQLMDKELQLCCLLRADFSTKEISVVTQQSVRTIYQRKSTIRHKLTMNEKEDIIEFILSQV